MSNGKYGIIVKKETESLEVPEVTYNFEVEDNHNYYVGKKSVLVHNKNCGSDYLEDTNICTKGQLVNRNAPGQKHHVIGNRPYKELQKKDWGKHLNRNDYLMKALTVDGHKGYQHWHIALDNELIEAVNNSDSLEVFQRKLNMIYSNPDIVKKFGRVNIILLLP